MLPPSASLTALFWGLEGGAVTALAFPAFVILAVGPEVSPISQRAPRPFPRRTPTLTRNGLVSGFGPWTPSPLTPGSNPSSSIKWVNNPPFGWCEHPRRSTGPGADEGSPWLCAPPAPHYLPTRSRRKSGDTWLATAGWH